MRENSATDQSTPAHNRLTVPCPTCSGIRWVSAVVDTLLQILCPVCAGQGRLLALAIAIDGRVKR
jgi:hypothetical protein